MSLLPPDDDLELMHTRNYETRVYLVGEDELLVRGAITDEKPPDLYVEGDPDPLEIHQMQVEMRVGLTSLHVTAAKVVFETHPHTGCPRIADHYESLVGLEIARGFTHKIRELFGGPRGCTHTTALLQAMAPAVIQSLWSVTTKRRRMADSHETMGTEEREKSFERNINTCHIWDENGEQVQRIRRGESIEAPIQITERLVSLGRSPDEWMR